MENQEKVREYLRQRQITDRYAQKLGITDFQMNMVLYLGSREGTETTPQDVINSFPLLAQSTVATALRSFRKKDLATISLDQKDLRRHFIVLTENGKRTYKEIEERLSG